MLIPQHGFEIHRHRHKTMNNFPLQQHLKFRVTTSMVVHLLDRSHFYRNSVRSSIIVRELNRGRRRNRRSAPSAQKLIYTCSNQKARTEADLVTEHHSSPAPTSLHFILSLPQQSHGRSPVAFVHTNKTQERGEYSEICSHSKFRIEN